MFVNIDLFVGNEGHSAHNVSGDGPLEFALPPDWVEARVMSAGPMHIHALMSVAGSDRTLSLGIGRLDGGTMLTIPHAGILFPAVGLRFEAALPEAYPTPAMIRLSQFLESGWRDDDWAADAGKLLRAVLDKMEGPALEAALAAGWLEVDG